MDLKKQLMQLSKQELIDCIERAGYFRPHGKGPIIYKKEPIKQEEDYIDKEHIIASIIVPYLLIGSRDQIEFPVSNYMEIEEYYNTVRKSFLYDYRGFNELNKEYKRIERQIKNNINDYFETFNKPFKFILPTPTMAHYSPSGIRSLVGNEPSQISNILIENNNLKIYNISNQLLELGNTIPYEIGKYINNFERKYFKLIELHYLKSYRQLPKLDTILRLKSILFIRIRPQDKMIIREFGIPFPNDLEITVGIGEESRLIVIKDKKIAFVPLKRVKENGIIIFKITDKKYNITYIINMLNDKKMVISQFKKLLEKN
jgi:hypothetical protein